MAQMTLSEVAEKMRGIDIAMLSTITPGGEIATRPMSNNAEAPYDGISHFFATEQAGLVADITRHPKVGLSFQGRGGIVGQRPFLISVEGEAELIRNRGEFIAHWNEDLTRWFAKDVDTPGLVLVRVRATRIHYWDGDEYEGELVVI